MMSTLSDFFDYSVPWWIWAFPTIAALFTTFTVIARAFGIRNAIAAAVAVGSALIIALSYRRGKQHGWQERIQRENTDAEKISKRARAARDRALATDPAKLRDSDGFKRRD